MLNDHRLLPARCYEVPAMALFVCQCVSVTSRCSIETSGRIQLVLAWRFSLTYPTLYYSGIQVFTKITVLPCKTLSQTLELQNFVRHHVEHQLSSTKVGAQSVINWIVVGQLS